MITGYQFGESLWVLDQKARLMWRLKPMQAWRWVSEVRRLGSQNAEGFGH